MTRSKLVSLVSLSLPAFLFGCSEAVPPAAEGAWMATVYAGAYPAECNLDSIEPIRMGDVDATQHNVLEKHTVNNAQIYCSVVNNGSTFQVDGYAANGLATLQIGIDAIAADASQTSPASGSLGVAGPPTALGMLTTVSEPCNFYFVNDQAAQLADGRVWLTFACPTVEDVSIGRKCGVQIGYAAFQNCEQ